MKLTATNTYPNLKAQVEATADPDDDPRDNDKALRVGYAEQGELAKLLAGNKLDNDEDDHLHSCRRDFYSLFGGMAQVRLGAGTFELVVKDEAKSKGGVYWKDVTATERGPWWKMLRNAVLDAVEADYEEQMADTSNLEAAFAQHFEKPKKATKKK